MVRHLRLPTLVALFVAVCAVAVAAAPYAYVSNSGAGNVLVIDTSSNTASTISLPVGKMPWGVALSADGARAYVTNFAISGTLLAIDTATGGVIKELSVGRFPFAVAVNPLTGKVFVSVAGSSKVLAVDPVTFAAPPISVSSPRGLAVNQAGTRLYVASDLTASLNVFDAGTGEYITSYEVGAGPRGVAVSYDGSRVYVTNEDSNTVSIINLAGGTVSHVPVGTAPIGVTLTPDGSRVYVANSKSGTVSVLDADGSRLRADIAVGAFPYGISTDGAKVYVAVRDANKVTALDLAGTLIAEVPANRPIGFGQFVLPQLVIVVGIDITPGGNPNTINLRSKGTLPVAILGSAAFNVADVDPTTVTLAGAPVAVKRNGDPMASYEDVNEDGFVDLVVHVERDKLQLKVGDTEAVLKGKTYAGMAIQGTDEVRVIQ